MAIALTLTGLLLLACTLCSALVLLLSSAEEPGRGYGWAQKPEPPFMRIASGCKEEKAPTHLPQHIPVDKVATGS